MRGEHQSLRESAAPFSGVWRALLSGWVSQQYKWANHLLRRGRLLLQNMATFVLDALTILRYQDLSLKKYSRAWVDPAEIKFGFLLTRPPLGWVK